MATRKPYSPVVSYQELKRVEQILNQAQTVEAIRQVVAADGPKVGYKALCYMLAGKMSPEEMKPDEACVAGAILEQQNRLAEATEIYLKVLAFYPDHPIAKSKVSK